MSGNQHDEQKPGTGSGLLQKIGIPVSTALQFAVVSSVSFGIALFLSNLYPYSNLSVLMMGAMWAMISGILVTQDTRSATISTAWFRVLGSLIGAIFSAIYLTFFPFSILGMGILIGIVVLTCELIRMPTYLRLAALTAGFIMVISAENPGIPPFLNAAHRFLEVIIGSSVAVGAAWIWQYGFRKE